VDDLHETGEPEHVVRLGGAGTAAGDQRARAQPLEFYRCLNLATARTLAKACNDTASPTSTSTCTDGRYRSPVS
jgi:hypothetical protein